MATVTGPSANGMERGASRMGAGRSARLAVVVLVAALALAGCSRPANVGTRAAEDFEAWVADHPLPAGEVDSVGANNALPFAGEATVAVSIPEGEEIGPVWDHLCSYEPEYDTRFTVAMGPVLVTSTDCEASPSWAPLLEELQLEGVEAAFLEWSDGYHAGPRDTYAFDVSLLETADDVAAREALRPVIEAARDQDRLVWIEATVPTETDRFDYEEDLTAPEEIKAVLDVVMGYPRALRGLSTCSMQVCPTFPEGEARISGQAEQAQRLQRWMQRNHPDHAPLVSLNAP